MRIKWKMAWYTVYTYSLYDKEMWDYSSMPSFWTRETYQLIADDVNAMYPEEKHLTVQDVRRVLDNSAWTPVPAPLPAGMYEGIIQQRIVPMPIDFPAYDERFRA